MTQCKCVDVCMYLPRAYIHRMAKLSKTLDCPMPSCRPVIICMKIRHNAGKNCVNKEFIGNLVPVQSSGIAFFRELTHDRILSTDSGLDLGRIWKAKTNLFWFVLKKKTFFGSFWKKPFFDSFWNWLLKPNQISYLDPRGFFRHVILLSCTVWLTV
jgi:hypothetical protein